MKKVYLLITLLSISYIGFSQITIVREDIFDLGTEYPRMYYAFEQEGDSYPVDSIINDSLVFDDFVFPFTEIDTLVYEDPTLYDTAEYYTNSTCTYFSRNQFRMYLKITSEKVMLVGIQGIMPMTEVPMNLRFNDTLVMKTFPCVSEATHEDEGYAYEIRHISVFESVIPEAYYGIVSSSYDSVRLSMNLSTQIDYDEYGELKCVGDSNLNGTFNYLRENNTLVSSFDIELRSKSTGSYIPINDAPMIGSQLPMDFPIVDTTYKYLYWTKDLKNPITQIGLNSNHDSVYNATFVYAFRSGVPQNIKIKHQVYPNPAQNILNIYTEEYQKSTIKIYSIDGKLLLTEELKSQNQMLNIQNYKKGEYIYKILDKYNLPIAGGKFVKH